MSVYDERTNALESYIKCYIPSIWKEPIIKVAFCPHITTGLLQELEEAYITGVPYKLPRSYDKWYIREAIDKFFENERRNYAYDKA
jgi:hypothetical protein